MSKYNPAGGGTYTLGASIGSTDTTITLSSFLEPVTLTPYTMALLNTDIAFATIGPRTSQSEFISFTGITQNADGTATLTGVVRGLQKKYPFTTSASLKLPHSGQTIFILSDVPQVFVKYASLENDNAFSGANTFSGATTFSLSPQVPGGATGSGAVNADQLAAAVFSGASDMSTTVTGIGRISISSDTTMGTPTVTIASPAVFSLTSHGLLVNDSVRFTTTGALPTGLVVGTTYYIISAGLTANAFEVSATRGGAAVNTSGSQSGTHTVIRTTPIAVGTLDPRVPTQAENDSLVGNNTDIAVGSGNKMVTQTGLQKQVELYGTDSVGSDAYAVTLSPVPTSYATGMPFRFKAGTANTGASTLNINSLGAKTLKKITSAGKADTETGDIVANQIVEGVYDGTDLVITSRLAGDNGFFASGQTTFALSSATGTTTLAHGLGRTPKFVRVTFLFTPGGTNPTGTGFLTYNGSNNGIYFGYSNGPQIGNGASVVLYAGTVNQTQFQTMTISAVDATNITLANTLTGSCTGTCYILWEAIA